MFAWGPQGDSFIRLARSIGQHGLINIPTPAHELDLLIKKQSQLYRFFFRIPGSEWTEAGKFYANSAPLFVGAFGKTWAPRHLAFEVSQLRLEPLAADNSVEATVEPLELPQYSAWMDGDKYQVYFDERRSTSYPIIVEGRLVRGNQLYRAVFAPIPTSNFAYYTHHGLPEQTFIERDHAYRSNGFVPIFKQSFTDNNGVIRIQGTWVKRNRKVDEK
jgi:hypothetical protein